MVGGFIMEEYIHSNCSQHAVSGQREQGPASAKLQTPHMSSSTERNLDDVSF